ncbi:unnamed protein product [Boreogadus saida]
MTSRIFKSGDEFGGRRNLGNEQEELRHANGTLFGASRFFIIHFGDLCAELRWKMSTGWEQDLFDGKAAVLATAEGRSIRTGTGGDSYGFTFDQVTAMDPVAESPSTLAGYDQFTANSLEYGSRCQSGKVTTWGRRKEGCCWPDKR